MKLPHPWLQRQVQIKYLPKDTRLALQNVGKKQALKLLSHLHTKVEAKGYVAISPQLSWTTKQLRCAKSVVNHAVLIIKK